MSPIPINKLMVESVFNSPLFDTKKEQNKLFQWIERWLKRVKKW
jgi:hypothetical protein